MAEIMKTQIVDAAIGMGWRWFAKESQLAGFKRSSSNRRRKQVGRSARRMSRTI